MREAEGVIFRMPKLRDMTEAMCVTTNGIIRRDGRAVMGAGVAKAFKELYPGIDLRLAEHLRTNGNVPGDLGVYDGCHVLSFPTKNDWKDNSSIALIEQSAIKLKQLATKLNLTEIFLPRPGCTNGHLVWNDVKPVLEKHLDNRFVAVNTIKTHIVLTADDEEPNCMQCDYVTDGPIMDDMGEVHGDCHRCGPEYCWAYYARTVDE